MHTCIGGDHPVSMSKKKINKTFYEIPVYSLSYFSIILFIFATDDYHWNQVLNYVFFEKENGWKRSEYRDFQIF